jgi:plasmid stabilization system protein ParE
MAREVVWAETAFGDLKSIAEYINRDSAHYASAFVQEVIDAARTLSEFAERGRQVPEFDDENFRELLVRSYRLVYRIESGRVLVLGVIHGARREGR